MAAAAANNTGRKVIFKNCAPITDCINEINNTQVDNGKDIDVAVPNYNVIQWYLFENIRKFMTILKRQTRLRQ